VLSSIYRLRMHHLATVDLSDDQRPTNQPTTDFMLQPISRRFDKYVTNTEWREGLASTPFSIRITVVALLITGRSLPSNGQLSKSCALRHKVEIAEKLHAERLQFSGGQIVIHKQWLSTFTSIWSTKAANLRCPHFPLCGFK